jgi:hypothetical protein
MHRSLITFLTQPVSSFSEKETKKLAILTTGIIVILVLVLLDPFSIRNPDTDPLFMLYLSGYGIVGSFILFIFEGFVKKQVAWFNAGRMPLYRHIVFYMMVLLVLSLANYGYYNLNQLIYSNYQKFQFPDKSFTAFLQRTLMVGIFPVCGLIVYFRMRNRIQRLKTDISIKEGMITFKAERGNDHLRIPFTNLLFIEAKGNYVMIQYTEKNEIRKKLIRSSLKKIETEFEQGHLTRCHQSFIINNHRISSFQNTAQGASVQLIGMDSPVPVSRKYAAATKLLVQSR